MTGITIRGTGRYLPERVVNNEDFTFFLETSNEWIISHTGIENRRLAVDEPTWYMGAQAAKAALEAANLPPSQVDMIIGTTVTADYSYPSMACLVQGDIGASNAFCFDISAACAGFAYALDMARRYLNTEGVETVLIVSSETLTQAADYTDRSTCVLFGDGAGAVLLTKGDGRFASDLHSDGSGGKYLYAKHTRQETPFSAGVERRNLSAFQNEKLTGTYMDGHEVYRFATKAMPRAVTAVCDKLGMAPGDLDLILPHQANLRIIQTAAKNLALPMDMFYVNIHNYGNTSSATCSIGLDECVRGGLIKNGDTICTVGFGSGLVYGAVAFDYSDGK